MLRINQLSGFGAGAPAATISLTDHSVSGSGTTFTFTNAAIGAAASGRRVVVGAGSIFLSAGITISSVTIGGNAATQLVTSKGTAGGIDNLTDIWILQVDAGTTATIVVTLSSAVAGASIAVWAAYNLNSSTPIDTGSSVASPATDTLNISGGGVAVGYLVNSNATLPTATWSGLTESVDEVMTGTSAHGAAQDAFGSIQSLLSITATLSGSSLGRSMALASFR